MGCIIVTGGQRGIGLGIARVLHGAGHAVAIVSESGDAGVIDAALAEIGPRAAHFRHDLRDTDRIPALLDSIAARMGAPHALVSNAGVGAPQRGDMLTLAPDAFDLVSGINLRGTFFLAQAVARRLVAAPADPYRSMVFVTSVSARMASEERAEYCMSKAGAAMMVALFARRLAQDGIGVFEIRPGIISSPMTAPVRERYDGRIRDGLVPARRWGLPEDVARAVLPLIEGRMAYSTGAVIPVDGGLSIPTL
ncbi:3-ketoacyl-ACP reductase [Oceaniglobus indicus]|uniref:3-ketoacyl-ACP reductase n=1 Tax=Oceaniglobus indicus TaxID=2047749 RepID=UPI000C186802|nr:3-ketoacyl-ACP reductase [Oceaniglobus indicus]